MPSLTFWLVTGGIYRHRRGAARSPVPRPLLAVVPVHGLSSTLTPTLTAQPDVTTDPAGSAAARTDAERTAIDNEAGVTGWAVQDREVRGPLAFSVAWMFFHSARNGSGWPPLVAACAHSVALLRGRSSAVVVCPSRVGPVVVLSVSGKKRKVGCPEKQLRLTFFYEADVRPRCRDHR